MQIEMNRIDYQKEKEAKERRLQSYSEEIQKNVLRDTERIVNELLEERHRQRLTQCDMADITGMKASNIARFESGARVPTLTVLQKYASALGKRIELKICDGIIEK